MHRKRFIVGLAVAVCLGLSVGASQAAAGTASRLVETDIFPDTVCGFSGTKTLAFNLTFARNGIAGTIVDTFVADNGRGVKVTFDAGLFVFGPTIYYPDGSSSFTTIGDGLNAKTQAVGGPLLEQSTGRVVTTFYLDADGNFVNQTMSTSGPENNTTGDFDCSVVGPYLAGG